MRSWKHPDDSAKFAVFKSLYGCSELLFSRITVFHGWWPSGWHLAEGFALLNMVEKVKNKVMQYDRDKYLVKIRKWLWENLECQYLTDCYASTWKFNIGSYP